MFDSLIKYKPDYLVRHIKEMKRLATGKDLRPDKVQK
jgi:hypothetical protein